MKPITRFAFMAGTAAILLGAMADASEAAPKRVVFTVNGDPTCQKFFNDPNAKQLSIAKNNLSSGQFTDGAIVLGITFIPSGAPTQIENWTSVDTPPNSPPKAVNALIIKTGAASTGDAQVIFYTDPVTSDSEPILIGDKSINHMSVCYGVGAAAEQLGYAACTLTATQLTAACPSSPDSFFFVRYNATALATEGQSKPELCACSGVTSTPCNPDPNKGGACISSVAGETLLNLSTQSVLTTMGSPCYVTVCTSFFGRQICQQQKITSPSPCTP